MNHREHLATQYHERVCRALLSYVREGRRLHLHSERDEGALNVTLRIEEADAFHALLEQEPLDGKT